MDLLAYRWRRIRKALLHLRSWFYSLARRGRELFLALSIWEGTHFVALLLIFLHWLGGRRGGLIQHRKPLVCRVFGCCVTYAVGGSLPSANR
jgi:hypothetical protein